MTIVTSWRDLAKEVARIFPSADPEHVLSRPGDMGALITHVAETHHLTFAEATEMVTFRLPQYLEAEPLSA